MTGFTTTTRGRYKCSFCDHKSYKTISGVLTHVHANHELELEKATSDALRAEVERLRNKPPKIVERERVVYRDPPAKPEPKKEYWYPAGLYCATCKVVMTRAGIPNGQTIENTPHSICGTRALMLVTEVQ